MHVPIKGSGEVIIGHNHGDKVKSAGYYHSCIICKLFSHQVASSELQLLPQISHTAIGEVMGQSAQSCRELWELMREQVRGKSAIQSSDNPRGICKSCRF